MKKLYVELIENESGLILSAELVLVLTIAVLGVIVGLVTVQTAVVTEFQDIAMAFAGLNQSYRTPTFFGCRKWFGPTSFTAGSGFVDFFDGCVGTSTWGGGGGGGFGGGYGGGGGYAEIGGNGYYGGQSSSTTTTDNCITPQTSTTPITPCETCTPGETTTTPVLEQTSPTPYSTAPSNTSPSPLPPPPIPTRDQ